MHDMYRVKSFTFHETYNNASKGSTTSAPGAVLEQGEESKDN